MMALTTVVEVLAGMRAIPQSRRLIAGKSLRGIPPEHVK
jgi:hypothetical protein